MSFCWAKTGQAKLTANPTMAINWILIVCSRWGLGPLVATTTARSVVFILGVRIAILINEQLQLLPDRRVEIGTSRLTHDNPANRPRRQGAVRYRSDQHYCRYCEFHRDDRNGERVNETAGTKPAVDPRSPIEKRPASTDLNIKHETQKEQLSSLMKQLSMCRSSSRRSNRKQVAREFVWRSVNVSGPASQIPKAGSTRTGVSFHSVAHPR